MKIVITGGHGFIGTNLAKKLPNAHALSSQRDVLDPEGMQSLACSSDIIIHLAGLNRAEDGTLLDTNILGTYNLARACLEQSTKLLIAGSDYEHGAYGASKKISQKIIEEFFRLGLKAAYMHIPKVFGPHCKPFYNSFVSTILHSVAAKIPYRHMVQAPAQLMHLIHVEDLCDQIINICRSDFEYLSNDPYQNLPNYNIIKNVHQVKLGDFCDYAEGSIAPNPDFERQIRGTLKWYSSQIEKETKPTLISEDGSRS